MTDKKRAERKLMWMRVCAEANNGKMWDCWKKFEALLRRQGLEFKTCDDDEPGCHTHIIEDACLYDYKLSNGEIYCWEEPL